ncbi:multicopper oxidase-domain-containing protein [Protomyces lactucae-debilis]|uniref:Multicopper oxidase-domain-containing protein n=1 Tax=Protomyces lactucae-debilis TaxID=2754530 RepID=A0A1Y2FIJ4_PROLT|nr:multicopper oxidase-domain-containing protein [Protomyces lactucae-debilis]ORY83204.1 multicopper oxidase-domain-containing protein [Protomyces lactucae-debilis]
MMMRLWNKKLKLATLLSCTVGFIVVEGNESEVQKRQLLSIGGSSSIGQALNNILKDVPVIYLGPPSNGIPTKTVNQPVQIKPPVSVRIPSVADLFRSTRGKFGVAYSKAPDTPNRRIWRDGLDIKTDYTNNVPETGRVVKYTLHVSESTNLAPAGVNAPFMKVFNGQFPGPLIEANWGDEIEVLVINHLAVQGTSIHWHGFVQTDRNRFDGVNGVSQCPIPPNSQMLYKIRAERYGTTWYHSHTSVQYGDGLYGPIVIHGPTSADWDVDLGPLILGDAYDESQDELVKKFFKQGPQAASATLFNGRGVRSDSGNLRGSFYEITQKVKFKRGYRYLLRLINASVDQKFQVSLDNHTMTVVAFDFVPVEPYEVETALLSIGQRMDVVITATGVDDMSYWFRADTSDMATDRGTTCGDLNLSKEQSKAIVRYVQADSSDPTTQPHTYTPHCSDEINSDKVVPMVPLTLPAPAQDQIYKIAFKLVVNASGDINFLADNSSLFLDWSHPSLGFVYDRITEFPRPFNVYELKGEPTDTVLIVLQDTTGIPHPIHLHGHDMSIAALGTGTWDGNFDLDNPPRRDTVQMDAGGHLAMHFRLDNPGLWLFHCHIAFHVSSGFGAQFAEQAKDIDAGFDELEEQGAFRKLCAVWDKWKQYNSIVQIDSGV